MGSELSMAARVEITAKYARACAKASKKERGRLLDEVVAALKLQQKCPLSWSVRRASQLQLERAGHAPTDSCDQLERLR